MEPMANKALMQKIYVTLGVALSVMVISLISAGFYFGMPAVMVPLNAVGSAWTAAQALVIRYLTQLHTGITSIMPLAEVAVAAVMLSAVGLMATTITSAFRLHRPKLRYLEMTSTAFAVVMLMTATTQLGASGFSDQELSPGVSVLAMFCFSMLLMVAVVISSYEDTQAFSKRSLQLWLEGSAIILLVAGLAEASMQVMLISVSVAITMVTRHIDGYNASAERVSENEQELRRALSEGAARCGKKDLLPS